MKEASEGVSGTRHYIAYSFAACHTVSEFLCNLIWPAKIK